MTQNGHHHADAALMDIHLLPLHQVTLMRLVMITTNVRMTALTCCLYHPHHVDVHHPPLRLPINIIPGQIMTLKWVGQSLEHRSKP
jgi:hypothetical protein